MSDKRFTWQHPRDAENSITARITEEGDRWRGDKPAALRIEVSDEQAVDSYNATFNCGITLSIEAARGLREFLNEVVK